MKKKREILKILIVIPCYNEEDMIIQSLNQIKNLQTRFEQLYKQKLDVLIIDDGSQDKSKILLLDWKERPTGNNRIKVIFNQINRGYGYTLKVGFHYAQKHMYQWVITFDMDGQHETDFLEEFYLAIRDAGQDIHLFSGTRYKNPELFWQTPWKDRFLVNTIITAILNQYGLPLTDSFCGMKAHRVDSLSKLQLTLTGYEMPLEMMIKGYYSGWKIQEIAVPLIYKNRETIQTKERSKRFIFAQAEERLSRYWKIIQILINSHQTHQNNQIINFSHLIDLYQHLYNSLSSISASNFKIIQQKIHIMVDRIFKSNISSRFSYNLKINGTNLIKEKRKKKKEICSCLKYNTCSPTCEICPQCKSN
ncbi:glycosyltransferase family 2 protein [Candidatus Harpocratesius sp.]